MGEITMLILITGHDRDLALANSHSYELLISKRGQTLLDTWVRPTYACDQYTI